MIKIAVWNLPPAGLMVSGFVSGPKKDRFEILRVHQAECERLLDTGEVDVALLPTLTILKNVDHLDVLPAVALSSWSYPFARLVVDHGLDEPIRRVVHDESLEMETFLTRLTLKEHYRMEPEFVPMAVSSTVDLLKEDADGHLLVGADVPTMSFERLALNLGQEWFELAQYPMCWGLFAARKGTATPELIRAVRNGVAASEKHRPVWIRAQETSPDLHTFFAEEMRFRLDDLVVASLTELRQYLFFYELLDDVRDIPFVFLEENEEGDDDGGSLEI